MKQLIFILITLFLKTSLASDEDHTYTVDLSTFEEPEDLDHDYDEGYGNHTKEDEYDRELSPDSLTMELEPEDRAGCGDCEMRCMGTTKVKLMEGESKTLCSKTFPKMHGKGESCNLDVMAPPDSWIKLTFCYFSLHYSAQCKHDKLVVLDQAMGFAGVTKPCEKKVQRVRRFCGKQHGKTYYVKTPYTRFKFQTNKDNKVRPGFKLKVEAVKNPCYFKLKPPSGTIALDKMKGSKYHGSYYCRWDYDYAATSNEVLQISCPKFDVHPGARYKKLSMSPDCMHITASDGGEASFTGKKGPKHTSIGVNTTIEFLANRQFQRSGFKCSYKIVPAGELKEPCVHMTNCLTDRMVCVKDICECDGSKGYGEATDNGKQVCVTGVPIGEACEGNYDCEAEDINSECADDVCACKSGFADITASVAATHNKKQCQPMRQYNNGQCYADNQCDAASNLMCTGGKCKCKSGFAEGCGSNTNRNKCFPALVVPRNMNGRTFNMPSNVPEKFRFCVVNFSRGRFGFKQPNSNPNYFRMLQYTWESSTKMRTYRKIGKKGYTYPKKTYHITSEPDYFYYYRSGANNRNSVLKHGIGNAIVNNGLAWAPTKWNQVFLWTAYKNNDRKIVFLV